MYSYNATCEAVEVYLTPSYFFHNSLQCRGSGEASQGMRQVIIFLKCFANNCAEQRSQLVEVKMEKRTENPAWGVADLKTYNPSARSYHSQHFTKALTNVCQVTYSKGGAAAIDAIIRQVNVFSVANT